MSRFPNCPTRCLRLGSYPLTHESMKGMTLDMTLGMLHLIFIRSTNIGEACLMRLRQFILDFSLLKKNIVRQFK